MENNNIEISKQVKKDLIKSAIAYVKEINDIDDNELMKRWGVSKTEYERLLNGDNESVKSSNIIAMNNDLTIDILFI